MKVILFHPPGPRHRAGLNTFGAVWAYYLTIELKKLGVEVILLESMRHGANALLSPEQLIEYHENLDISGVDHIIGLGIRYWSLLPECGEVLRSRLGRFQCLAQIHDASLLDRTPADVTFALRDRSAEFPPGSPDGRHELYHRHTCLVGWAADAELCRPNQPETELRILVDHSAFSVNQADVTLTILMNLRKLVESPELWRDRYKSIRIRHFTNDGIVDLDVTGDICVRPYTRKHVSYEEACEEYSAAHIFIVTHLESVGQTVIETATAGALILTYADFIGADLLATVRHYKWSKGIRWGEVLSRINVKASRKMAIQNSWSNIAKRMVDYLGAFDRTKVGWPQK